MKRVLLILLNLLSDNITIDYFKDLPSEIFKLNNQKLSDQQQRTPLFLTVKKNYPLSNTATKI
jgi:hypothetical protein